MVLDRGMAKASGLVLMAATPNYGGFTVYRNWMSMDPWFVVRMYLRDWGHPRSPLSSTQLVRNAFFSKECDTGVVEECERGLAEYESLIWPLSLMRRFVDVRRVLDGCLGKLLVLAAEEDRLMGLKDMRRMVAEYRRVGFGEVEWACLEGSGHSLQMDVKWREAASILESWLQKEAVQM